MQVDIQELRRSCWHSVLSLCFVSFANSCSMAEPCVDHRKYRGQDGREANAYQALSCDGEEGFFFVVGFSSMSPCKWRLRI